jgi:hypothetical protein
MVEDRSANRLVKREVIIKGIDGDVVADLRELNRRRDDRRVSLMDSVIRRLILLEGMLQFARRLKRSPC